MLLCWLDVRLTDTVDGIEKHARLKNIREFRPTKTEYLHFDDWKNEIFVFIEDSQLGGRFCTGNTNVQQVGKYWSGPKRWVDKINIVIIALSTRRAAVGGTPVEIISRYIMYVRNLSTHLPRNMNILDNMSLLILNRVCTRYTNSRLMLRKIMLQG